MYDSLNHPDFPWSVPVNSGFMAHVPVNPAATSENFLALTFRFADFGMGETFEFDCDTDGGGTSGGAMSGLYVEVELANGRLLCLELRQDPVNQDRAVGGAR